MKTPTSRARRRLILMATLLALAPGCGSNENSQFIQLGPPGPQPDHPNEGYTDRRSRTFRPSRVQNRQQTAKPAPAKP